MGKARRTNHNGSFYKPRMQREIHAATRAKARKEEARIILCRQKINAFLAVPTIPNFEKVQNAISALDNINPSQAHVFEMHFRQQVFNAGLNFNDFKKPR